jgi:hypothetical protein
MTSEGTSAGREDPGHPIHDRYPGAQAPADIPIDEEKWSAVEEGRRVVDSLGERLGRVEQKSSHVFEVNVPRGLFEKDEIYVPHFAVERIDGNDIHLNMSRAELIDAYDHFYRHHIGRE